MTSEYDDKGNRIETYGVDITKRSGYQLATEVLNICILLFQLRYSVILNGINHTLSILIELYAVNYDWQLSVAYHYNNINTVVAITSSIMYYKDKNCKRSIFPR